MVNLHLSAIRDRFTDHYGDENDAEIERRGAVVAYNRATWSNYVTYNPYRYDFMMNTTKNKRR